MKQKKGSNATSYLIQYVYLVVSTSFLNTMAILFSEYISMTDLEI